MFFEVPFYRVTLLVSLDSFETATHDFNSIDEAQSFFDSELERLSAIDTTKFDCQNLTQDQIIEIEHERLQQALSRASIDEWRSPPE